jgi:tRNA threonylcarbamoyl adenosine modification protein (Sua5/YciO/YrdC/YwlC family)
MILATNPHNPQKRHIGRAVEILEQGGLVSYPTDSSYGIGCDILNKRAIEKIYALKKKDKHQFVSIICADLKDLSSYAVVSNAAYRILRKHLPGPYTFVLPATRLVPKIMLTPRKTVGIRVPESRIVRDLVLALGRPLINTSATTEDGTYLKDPCEIERIFRGKIAAVLAAPCPGEPSSIVDLVNDEPSVIRRGLGDLTWLE